MMRDSSPPSLIHLVRISKAFSGVQALRDVKFAARPGEVHAILGDPTVFDESNIDDFNF